MAGFSEILGHEQIIEHLQNAIQMKKVSHAYILDGEESAGKMMLARAFAQRAGQREWLQIIPYRDEYEEMPQFGTVRRLYWEV